MTERTIRFEANGQYEATISEKPWRRSMVGPGYVEVKEGETSYVIAVTTKGFEAFPVEEGS